MLGGNEPDTIGYHDAYVVYKADETLLTVRAREMRTP
jgi:hypothetical protein